MAIAVTSLIFLILGVAIGAGGIWLVALGGNWYYLIAGLVFLVTAVLLWRRQHAALWLYAALMLGTLIWAISEIGFD